MEEHMQQMNDMNQNKTFRTGREREKKKKEKHKTKHENREKDWKRWTEQEKTRY